MSNLFPIPYLGLPWTGELPSGQIPLTSNVRPLSPTLLREEGPFPILGSTLRPGVVSPAPILASPGMMPGMVPGMVPGMMPGMGPGMGPGMMPGMGPGMGPSMGPGYPGFMSGAPNMPLLIRPSPVSNFRNTKPRDEYNELRNEAGSGRLVGNEVRFTDGIFTHVLKDESIAHAVPTPHHDFLYTTITLGTKNNLAGALANKKTEVQAISESVMIDLLKKEVTARCGSTAANYATLKTVIEVLTNSVAQSIAAQYSQNIADAVANKATNKQYIKDNI